MKLWDKEGKTEFPHVSGGLWSVLVEAPYCYGFDPTVEPEAEARINFEKCIRGPA